MQKFRERGAEIRRNAKALVIEFLNHHSDAKPGGSGIRQAEIFRACGFDWGGYPKATSSNQQFWLVGLLKEVEKEGHVVQISESGPWRKSS